jgi:hypothetical protein
MTGQTGQTPVGSQTTQTPAGTTGQQNPTGTQNNPPQQTAQNTGNHPNNSNTTNNNHPQQANNNPPPPPPGPSQIGQAPPPPVPTVPKPAGGGDDLDALLAGGTGNSGPAPAPAPVASSSPPLSKDDVVAGFNGVGGAVHGCFATYNVAGTAIVHLQIQANGSASGVSVQGPLAGTPEGNCVANAVSGAHWRSSAAPLSVTYPFQMH